MSPDGKFLYTASAKDYAIAIVERKPSGEITYKGSVDLDPVAKRIAGNDRYLWVSLAIAPDGKYLYAAVRNGRASENFYGIFKRNGETGELTFQETVSGEKDELANLRAWTVAFDPDGTTGYLGSLVGPFMTFQYDAKTGQLTHPAAVKGLLNHGGLWLAFDGANGLIYTGGGDYGISSWTLDVLKADPAAGKN
jgi:WD40 repeat protein